MQKKVKNILAFVVLFILFLFIAQIVFKVREADPKERGIITYGTFKEAKLFNGSTRIYFYYIINNNKHDETNYSTYQVYKNKEVLVGKQFPVIYDPDKPTNSQMLISKFDFNQIDLVQPDSLAWLCDSLGICD